MLENSLHLLRVADHMRGRQGWNWGRGAVICAKRRVGQIQYGRRRLGYYGRADDAEYMRCPTETGHVFRYETEFFPLFLRALSLRPTPRRKGRFRWGQG